MENQTKKPIHEYWSHMNEAMWAIENAALVAINNKEVLEHLKEYGCQGASEPLGMTKPQGF